MNKQNDTDLREAMRRREAKRPQVEVPDDFLSRVMQGVETAETPTEHVALWHTRRIALAALAVAASIALLVLLTRPRQAEQDFTGTKASLYSEGSHPLVGVKSEPAVAHRTPATEAAPTSIRVEAREARSSKPSRQKVVTADPRSASAAPHTNDLDAYLEQLESDLADVRDSCYLTQVERLIADSPDLQQLMYEMTNQKQ